MFCIIKLRVPSSPVKMQAEQALVPDQPRDFLVNYQDRRIGEMSLSIRVSIPLL